MRFQAKGMVNEYQAKNIAKPLAELAKDPAGPGDGGEPPPAP